VWTKPPAQEPTGVPNDAKSTDEITSPTAQPMSAFMFSGTSTQLVGGPGGGGGGVCAGAVGHTGVLDAAKLRSCSSPGHGENPRMNL
jgi:hypothetical protein